MTVVEVQPTAMLDENARDFVSTFMTHVATLSGYGPNRLATIAGIKARLLAALAHGDPTADAWRALYRSVDVLVEMPVDAPDARLAASARTYLHGFICDNEDLGHD